MPLINIAPIDISLDPAPATRPGFGIGALFADLTPAQEANFGPDKGVELTPAGFLQELDDLGITSGEAAHTATTDYFSQDAPGKPEKMILFRRDDPVAMLRTYVLTGNTDGTYSIELDGQTASFLAAAATIEVIRDGLSAALALLVNAADFTFADVSTDTITVEAAFAGLPFTSVISSPVPAEFTDTLTTPNTGLPEDLTDALAERTDFYAVFEDSHAKGNILALANAIEGQELIFLGQNDDALALDAASQLDLGSLLLALGYLRTSLWYSANAGQYVEGAILGKMLPTDPGSATWAFKELASVVGEILSSANDTTLENKNYSWLERYTALGKTFTRNGFVASGQFLDVIRGRDWLSANLQIDIIEALLANPKIGYDSEGIEILRSVVENRLRIAAEQGLVDLDSIVVTAIPKKDIDPSKIGQRLYDGIEFEAVLTGAIHKVPVTGSLKNAA